MTRGRVIVVDDHPLFRGALSTVLKSAFEHVEILEAGSMDELSALLSMHTDVELILLDLSIPGVFGLWGLLLLRHEHPAVPVAIVSATEDARIIRRTIELGASGYVTKSQTLQRIREAVRRILSGEVWVPPEVDMTADETSETSSVPFGLKKLTSQQVRVLMLLCKGLSNGQIAQQLSVTDATIKAHVHEVFHKLNVSTRTQAVIAVNNFGV